MKNPLNYLAVALALVPRAGLADTWSIQASGTTKDLSAVAILSADNLITVGDKSGTEFVIRYSTDGGFTWNTPSAPGAPAGNNLNAVDFNGNTVIAVGKGGTIAYSTDKGLNFTFPASPTAKELRAVAFITSTVVVATGQKDGANYTMARSTDGGTSWGTPTVPAGGKDLNALAFNGTTVVAVGDKSGANFTIIRSTDSGANWSDPASLPGGGENLNAVAFVNPATVVAVGKNGTILTSTDAGNNWAAEVSPTAQDLNALIASGTIVLAIGRPNGANFTLIHSTDNGDNWSVASTPAGIGNNLNAIDAGSSLMVAVGDNGAILTSTDSGANWISETSGTISDLFGVAIINPVIVVGQNGVILRSTSQALAGGSGPRGIGGDLAVPFEGEWLALALILACGLYRLRRAA